MKKINFNLILITGLFLVNNISAQQTQARSSKYDLPAPATDDWYSKAIVGMQQVEMGFYPSQSLNEFRTCNPVNRLSFSVNLQGYTVRSIQSNEGWRVNMSLTGIGREQTTSAPANEFVIIKNNNSLTYQSAPYDIEYINDPAGLRQNFIIHHKPVGNRRLRVAMQLETVLAVTSKNDRSIYFHTPGNEKDIKLYYEDLRVWDADHHDIPASLQYDQNTNTLSIIVNDEKAIYPLTIDPLNRTPEWTTSADGVLPGLLTNLQLQVQTAYGYTVAGLGDINGDGYDDVAISAPTMADVISGTGSLTGVGAVFIYLGSPSGLPATPSKVLQSTTAVDGALFGYSVDAGDITGDGKNDIVIGAPLDRYQTTAQGLFGPTSVNVSAGKVYVYRSEDLFSAPNPTPFLQVRLQGTGFFSTGILNLLQSNVTTKPLFGFSVAVTPDLNGDNKADLLIGAPNYLGIDLLSVQSGAAFVYYSSNLGTTSPVELQTPDPSLLGLIGLPIANTDGLLFGFSLDGVGDFNNDGYQDVAVGAPAGIDLSSLGGVFTGQFLGGSAFVYYGHASGMQSSIGARLQADASGLLSNTANLFGYEIKGAKNRLGINTGNILVGSPAGAVISNVVNGLRVKAGQVHVFKKNTTGAAGPFVSNQIISSPRSSSILSILSGQTINVSLMFGSSIDNMLDINCDGIGDIIVGEPLSTAVPSLGADVTGGAAYIYLGKGDGTYDPAPFWDLHAEVSPLLGVNATALIGYSVAGARYVRGQAQGVRSLIGGPSNSLDFGAGLLNLGNTLGVLFSFTFDNNGLGKAYTFNYTSCAITLPVTLVEFKGQSVGKVVALNWISSMEDDLSAYELQRSNDGINYQPIAVTVAKGNLHNEYQYTDQHPVTGMNYYRLKMIDRDGKFAYSNIVAVKFTEILSGDIIVAPNPVVSDLRIRTENLNKGVYRFDLLNPGGQLMLRSWVNISESSQVKSIGQVDQLNAGIYWLSVYDQTNNRIKTIKVVVSH